MLPPEWLIETPIDAILFDCDNTLSHIEGIDELAVENGVGERVKQITTMAMGKTGLNAEIYHDRLQLTQPTKQQINWLGERYIQQAAEDVKAVIHVFQKLNKAIYIISAGLFPSVIILGKYLNVPVENIFAVDIYFDKNGKYIDFEKNSVLLKADGKKIITQAIKQTYSRLGYTGDGINDCSVINEVTRFIGYGGAFYRKNIADLCQYYLTINSMAPFLPLLLTKKEFKQLSAEDKKLYQKGLGAIDQHAVLFKGHA